MAKLQMQTGEPMEGLDENEEGFPSAESFRTEPEQPRGQGLSMSSDQNVSEGERLVSLAAGAILAILGLRRGSLPGLAIAGVGGALAYRGATGHCSLYEKFGIDTAHGNGSKAGEFLRSSAGE